MSRLIQGLVVVVLLAAIMQWFVPRWTGSELAAQLQHYDHGPKPVVNVTAIPFWQLASGQFQDVYVAANKASFGALAVQTIRLNWRHGGVSLAQLVKGHVRVTKVGLVTVSMVLDGAALAHFLAQEGKISNPTVTISPQGLKVQGRLMLGGVYVPLDTQGSLVVSSNHRQLIFHPTSIDGIHLPMLTDIQVLNLATLKLPVALAIQNIKLSQDRLEVTAGNRGIQ